MGRGDEPGWNVAQRFRLEARDVEAARAEIHAHLRQRGRSACTWEVGSSATASALVERLLELGLVEQQGDSAVGMALEGLPEPEPPPGIEVRRSASQEDEQVAAAIAAECFGGAAVARRFV